MAEQSLKKFDPDIHRDNCYDAFSDYCNAFQYEYEAIAKDPPAGSEPEKAEWIQLNKRKVFLGRFASRNLQKDFEEVVPTAERRTITFDETVTRLKERYQPLKNTTLANFEFHKMKQTAGESFDLFLNRVKNEANMCSFQCDSDTCNVKDTMVRDQIVIGTTNDDVRKNALNNQWNLEELIKNGRKLEAATVGAQKITEQPIANVSRVNTPGKYSKRNRAREDLFKKEGKRNGSPPRMPKCNDCSSKRCKGGKKCPAFNEKCFKCGQYGHFKGSRTCTKGNRKHKQTRRVNDSSAESNSEESTTETEPSEESEDEQQHVKRLVYAARRVAKTRRAAHKTRKTPPPKRYEVTVGIKERVVKVYADTGADISIMSKRMANQLQLSIAKTSIKIKPYGSNNLKCLGHYTGPVMYVEVVANVRFYIVKKDLETLLSGAVCEELGIIKFQGPTNSNICSVNVDNTNIRDLTAKYPDLFKGIGTLKNHTVKLHIDDSITPTAEPARPIPFHLKARFQEEIKKMEENNIIEEHHGPAPWVSNPVLAPKENGGIRVTVDMRKPNRAIKDTHIPIPRVEDIRSHLSNCKIFSKLDFKSAFHQLELDPESRHITVFHAGDRLMRYRKLVMGTKPASDELTKALRPLFSLIPHAHAIHDDLILATETPEEHYKVLDTVFHTIQESGLTLNPEKCIFAAREIPFWGIKVTPEGIMPDP